MSIPFENVIYGLRDCTGAAALFVHEFVSKRLALRFETITTSQTETFSSSPLKEVYFAEAQHFVNRALYHLAVGKRLVSANAPTWGLVSFYYSSFFAAQAATRLRGTAFFRLTYDDRYHQAPTYRLEVVNFVTDKFTIRKAALTGEHQRIWNAFYNSFNGFSGRSGYADVSPITEPVETERRFAEMHRRHLVNYVPGFGYFELGSAKDLRRTVKNLEQAVRGRVANALDDPDQQLEAGAFLRFRLCCGLLQEIAAANGAYASFHRGFVSRRMGMLATLGCPQRLTRDLETIIKN